MARSGTGIGYTPSQTSTSMPGGFDEEQMAVARKRLMMQQLANEAPVDSGYRGSHWVNPYYAQVGSALGQSINALAQPEMDAQLQDIAQRRGAAADAWASNPPRLEDTPADPGNAGPSEGPGMMGPPAPAPGNEGEPVMGDQNQMGREYARALAAQQGQMGQAATINMETGAPTSLADTQMQPLEAAPAAPMVPQAPQDFAPYRAATAMIPKSSLGDVLQWATKGAAFSPMHAKLAEHTMQQALDAPAKKEAAQAAQDAKLAIAKEQIAAKIEAAKTTQEGREYLQRLQFNQQDFTKALASNDKEYLMRLAASLRPEKSGAAGAGTFSEVGTSASGNPVLANSKSGTRHEVIDGVPSETPYAGPVTPKLDQSKAVATAATGAKSIGDMQSALDAVTENPDLYSTRTAIASKFPAIGGIAAKVSGLNESELAQRANIASMTADTTHSLYGSAFSAGEQAQAKGFLINEGDSAEVVRAKLKGRMELEQRHFDLLPASAKAAYAARKGGAVGAARSDVSGDGWGVPTKR